MYRLTVIKFFRYLFDECSSNKFVSELMIFNKDKEMSEPYSRIEQIQTQPVDWTYVPTKS